MDELNTSIYDAPKEWESTTKNRRQMSAFASILLLVVGSLLAYFCYWVYYNRSFQPSWVFIIVIVFGPAFMIGMGLVVGIREMLKTDEKDSWFIRLPWNEKLYEVLVPQMESTLKNNGYEFESRDSEGEDVEKGRTFKIKIKWTPEFELKLAFEVFYGQHSTSHVFSLEIMSICSQNLKEILKLHGHIMEMLSLVNYSRYKSQY